MRKPTVKKDKVVITPQPPKDSTTTASKEASTVTPETDSKENPPKEVAKDQVTTEEE